MVQQGIAEALSGVCVIFGNVVDDISEILQRSLREEEAEIHLGRSSRTCSTETVRPDLTSRSPSSMAASVVSSSSPRTGAVFSKSDSLVLAMILILAIVGDKRNRTVRDRKSTRLNFSHTVTSYAV